MNIAEKQEEETLKVGETEFEVDIVDDTPEG